MNIDSVHMNLFCLGINHRTAPIELREKLWFSNDDVRTILPMLKKQYFQECVLISTCNRTELYYVPRNPGTQHGGLWRILSTYKNTDDAFGKQNFYSLQSINAVKHLFKLASGIDS